MRLQDTLSSANLIPSALIACRPEQTVAHAAAIMAQGHIGAVLVLDEAKKVVGILSERDIMVKVVACGRIADQVSIDQVMSPRVISCDVSTPLWEANQLMVSQRVRHLPVTREGRPLAMISSRDILRLQLQMAQYQTLVAEQIARLIKCLRSLDIEELSRVVVDEVPAMFQATCCRLSIPSAGDGTGSAGILLSKCASCHGGEAAAPSSDAQAPGHTCPCAPSGQSVHIPIDSDQEITLSPQATCRPTDEDSLCLCGLTVDEATRDILMYRAHLLQEVLGSMLVNAKLYARTRHQSMTDTLTGLTTRRVFDQRLREFVKAARRYGRSFCIAILDVDHFKSVNDHHGHDVGDHVLRELARILRSSLRSSDTCSRYGGDEMSLLLPEITPAIAAEVLNRIRLRCEKELLLPDGRAVTLSCGLAEWTAADETPESLFRKADTALYEAKNAGRNRVAVPATA